MELNLLKEDSRDVKELLHSYEKIEKFHTECDYKFEGRLDGDLVGIMAYITSKAWDDKQLPRFVHVILQRKYMGRPEGRELLNLTEEYLQKEGHKQLFACIKNKKYMQKTITRHGYKLWHENDSGKYYYKNLGE